MSLASIVVTLSCSQSFITYLTATYIYVTLCLKIKIDTGPYDYKLFIAVAIFILPIITICLALDGNAYLNYINIAH